MRLAPCIFASSLIGCAGSPTDDSGPIARCETTDCFYEREVRTFEVVDRSTIVVYVGQQRCPFVVELDGLSCDVSFAPEIHFFQTALGRIDRATPVRSAQICATTQGLYAYAGVLDPSLMGANDRRDPITGFPAAPGGGDFGWPTPGRVPEEVPIDSRAEDMCRVHQIRSVNDDQLLELYASEGVMPPPPPVGHGQLEVPEPVGDGARPDAAGGTEEGPAAEDGADARSAPARRSTETD